MLLGMNGLKERQNKDIFRSNALIVAGGTLNVSGSITANGQGLAEVKPDGCLSQPVKG